MPIFTAHFAEYRMVDIEADTIEQAEEKYFEMQAVGSLSRCFLSHTELEEMVLYKEN